MLFAKASHHDPTLICPSTLERLHRREEYNREEGVQGGGGRQRDKEITCSKGAVQWEGVDELSCLPVFIVVF